MPKGRFARLRADAQEFLERRHFSLPPELSQPARLTAALDAIAARWPDTAVPDGNREKPIFILSAGWRSGSTLLQRLVMSGTRTIVWGEPLGDTAIVTRLAHSLEIIGPAWPPDSFFPGTVPADELSGEWIANLTPHVHNLREAHRAFFLSWLRDPTVADYDAIRWGLKEVRLSIADAHYLRWLFPNAKFLFIVRNPIDAFRSWKGNRWRSPWPGYYRNSAIAFGRHWCTLADGFLAGYHSLGGMFIRYEDLIGGQFNTDELAAYLEFDSIDSTPLRRRIDTPKDKGPRKKRRVSLLDRLLISTICGSTMKKLGYR